MPMMSIFDIAGSGMTAQNLRLNATASNLANANSVSSNLDETYRARHPVFAARLSEEMSFDDAQNLASRAAAGVDVLEIVESDAPFRMQYEPHHPEADQNGYVAYPNVNVVEEMADMMSASRSFQLNVNTLNTVKTLAERLLAMGQ